MKCRGWGILLAAIAVAASVAHAGVEPGVAYLPRSDDEVLLRLPPLEDVRVRRAETLRRSLRAHPDDLASAVELSHLYIDYARSTGDARFLGRALAVVDPWLGSPSPPVAARMVRATVLQSRHAFAQSRALLEEILARDPENDQAWLTLASVAQVQGDMVGARHACARLMGSMDALIAAACIGGLDAVTGRARDGYEVMAQLLRQEPNEPAPIRAWVNGLLGDAARDNGEDALAESHFKEALAAAPSDNFLLADYSDFLLDHHRFGEVLSLIDPQTQSESLLLRRLLAESGAGDPARDTDIDRLRQQFHDLDVRGDSGLYAREHARFVLEVLHDYPLALRLAQLDWTIQREPQDVRILLQAALAAGNPGAARPAIEFALATGLQDPAVTPLMTTLRPTPLGPTR